MAGELERILAYMDTLNTLDTCGVEPMSHVFPVKNVLREDEVGPPWTGGAAEERPGDRRRGISGAQDGGIREGERYARYLWT
ncbi:MAG: Asp-tRNA(Asn)/Glu-tRNA(Gln) amidotransferase subunit GatC [Lawsonibacter sp.]